LFYQESDQGKSREVLYRRVFRIEKY